jgi:hypothetical protein
MPALNAELRRKISGTFADEASLVYLETSPQQVKGLLDGGKIAYSLLPDGVVGGMRFLDSFECVITSRTLFQIFGSHIESANKHSRIGSFVILTTGDNSGIPVPQIDITNSHTDANGNLWELKFYDDGEEVTGSTTTLEAGDWIIYKGWEVYNTDKIKFMFAVINNTYSLATIHKDGLMSKDDKIAHNSLVTTFLNFSQSAVNTTLTGANVFSGIVIDSRGRVTGVSSRTLTLANLGYTGAANATYNLKATKEEAEEGTDDITFLTPLRGKDAIKWHGLYSGQVYPKDTGGWLLASASHPDGAFALFLS